MAKDRFFTKKDGLILLTILICALGLRLYKVNTPLADWHSWRQVDTASVARNFAEEGFNLLKPTYDDVSNIQTGVLNPEGLRLVEFPIYNAFVAGLYTVFPAFPIEVYGRATTIFFSLVIISILYFLLLKEDSRIAAIAGSLTFAMLPFFVYYSRVVLPDMTALSFVFIAIFLLYQWKDTTEKSTYKGLIFFILSICAAALAVLIKPTAGFYFLALGWIFIQRNGINIIRRPSVYFYFIIALVPFFLWRSWIAQFPEGIPAFSWLFTSINTSSGLLNIFFKPAFFRWVFYERILLLILGGFASFFLFIGIFKRPKTSYLTHVIGVSALIYLFVFQGGNVQHDYYQIMILPALALFSGTGWSYLFEHRKSFIHSAIFIPALIGLFSFSAFISFYHIKDYYNYSRNLVQVGQIIQTITPSDALISTDTLGDTTMLYLSHRKGFPAMTNTVQELSELNIDYFVTQNPELVDKIISEYGDTYKMTSFTNERLFIFEL